MGKSALAWKWFNDIAPNELPKLAGRIWWSFYESDAHYENFLLRALTYAAGETEEVLRGLSVPEREDRLFALLDERPFLLVLDGIERMLVAYARMDAAQMLDDDLDERTAHRLAEGLPEAVRETYLEKHRLRRTADPRAGTFLKRLARLRHSRVLVSTRLYPADLQLPTGRAPARLSRRVPRGAHGRRRAEPVAGLRRHRLARAVAAALPGLRQLPAPAARPGRRDRRIPPRAARFRPLAGRPSRLRPGAARSQERQDPRAGIRPAEDSATRSAGCSTPSPPSACRPAGRRCAPSSRARTRPARTSGRSIPC